MRFTLQIRRQLNQFSIPLRKASASHECNIKPTDHNFDVKLDALEKGLDARYDVLALYVNQYV